MMSKKPPREHAYDIDPDEIFLDSSNLPDFDMHQFEGKMERPILFDSVRVIGLFAFLLLALFAAKLFSLQVVNGETYRAQSERNRLMHSTDFTERGVIVDRNDTDLAWNNLSGGEEVPERQYTELDGLGHVLGYTKAPAQDSSGVYYREYFEGITGVEALFDSRLRGENGTTIVETDVHHQIISKNLIKDPIPGEEVKLSVDAEVTAKLYENIKDASETYGYKGGASVIMDIHTGEVLAMTSYPETDPGVLARGGDGETLENYATDPGNPYLNRALNGVFTPGSIVKPFLATGMLEEGLIHPEDNILSDGALEVQNPYDEDITYVFRDWRAHGLVNMREAIAHSSDQYFYILGGGHKDMEGLGIEKIEHYMRLFGFGEETGMQLGDERAGVVPTPEWKQETFNEDWYLGNTYHTSIGQYGVLVTPLQAAQAIAAVANDGTLITPRISMLVPIQNTTLDLNQEHLRIVREGMYLGVEEGTARSLDFPQFELAAKTGTAEVGTEKGYENSWVIGFFPYENPRFAFATVLEHAPEEVSFGAAPSMRSFFEWLAHERPNYIYDNSGDI